MFLITFFFVLTLFYYRIDGRLESVNCIVPTLWLIVSILAYINPLNLYPITIYGQLVVSLYFFAYFVGYALLAYFVKENTVSQYRYEKVSYNYGYLATSGIIFIVLLLSIRFWSVFIDFISLYGFAGLFNAGIQVYSNRGTDLSIGLGVLLPIDYLSIFLGIVWFRTVKNRGLFKKIVYGYMMIIPFLLAFLIQSRLNIVIMFILYLNLNYLYRVKVINFRILLYLILCIFAISISRGIEMNSNLFGDSFFARILAGISYYTSIGLFAFDQFLNSTVSSSDYANYTFNGALRLIEFFFFTDIGSVIETRVFYTPLRTITATALMMLWSDYNFISVAFMLFLGALNCIVLRSGRKNIFSLLIASSLTIVMSVSFFALMTFNGGFWMFMLSGFFFSILLQYDRKN